MRMKGNPQRLSTLALETVRLDAVAMSPTTAGSEQHEGCAISTRNNRRRLIAMAGLAAGLLIGSNVVRAQIPCSYDAQIIEAPDCGVFGPPPTDGKGISASGDVVGDSWQCNDPFLDDAFVWTLREGFVTLDMPQGTFMSVARNISPNGQFIVGDFDVAGDGLSVIAFLIDGEQFIEIPPLVNPGFSQAVSVNDQRQVVGTTPDPRTGFHRAFRWEDGIIALIEPTFGTRSAGSGISESGIVAGWMGTAVGINSHAFVWDGRAVTDLGLAPNTFATTAGAVNDLDEVLVRGTFDENEPTDRITGSFLLRDAKFIDLGRLPGYDVIAGSDLNNESQVVGIARAVNSSSGPDVGFGRKGDRLLI